MDARISAEVEQQVSAPDMSSVEQVILPLRTAGQLPSSLCLKEAALHILRGRDLTTTSLGHLRAELEQYFSMPAGGFECIKEDLKALAAAVVAELTEKRSAEHSHAEDLGDEDRRAARQSYLVTFSRPTTTTAADGTLLKAPDQYSRENIAQALLRSLELSQPAKTTRSISFILMAVFLERHLDEQLHYHVSVKASGNMRFLPVKQQLLRQYGLATHWSTKHLGYASAVAYCYVPSPHKSLAELDPTPFLWAAQGCHPPLAEASRVPVDAGFLAAKREHSRRESAEAGKAEPRFQEVEIWPVVVQQNISSEGHGREQLMSFAKRCGGPGMVKFCWNNWARLQELIARAWQVEQVETFVEGRCRSRLDHLKDAQNSACVCDGRWLDAAKELLSFNGIGCSDWCGAMLLSLSQGRAKGSLVCHAGKEGDEGKSFLLQPLLAVYGPDAVFVTPPRSAFPLLGLETCRLALLDDWRFNEDLVSYNIQLLWFEGKSFVIARPQNQHSGHLRYVSDAPVFITTLESDITTLKVGLQQGDLDMMAKRLRVFSFHKKVVNPDRSIPACPRCFASFLMHYKTPEESNAAAAASQDACGSKRSAPGPTGSSPDRQRRLATWTVDQVSGFLAEIGLGHCEAIFRTNAVDGLFLAELSQADLVTELGLTNLQARKLLSRLP